MKLTKLIEKIESNEAHVDPSWPKVYVKVGNSLRSVGQAYYDEDGDLVIVAGPVVIS